MNDENQARDADAHRLQKEDVQQHPKKAYDRPHLTVHGSIEKITRSIGTQGADMTTGLGSHL